MLLCKEQKQISSVEIGREAKRTSPENVERRCERTTMENVERVKVGVGESTCRFGFLAESPGCVEKPRLAHWDGMAP